jgi:uncharacterized membrane protein YjgN (DUF898 family)
MTVSESELRERYRNTSDEDLLFLARKDIARVDAPESTDMAWALLREEMTRRGLRRPGDALGAPAVQVTAVTFTGRGSEYFRIWVVNLLLTLVTVGAYSAWAKVRKARYFRQNTRLDGHVFDYHGRPIAIFRGRLIALVLLSAYTWTFQFSNTAGLVTVAILCALGPWLLMRAQQFALANTSYRGLRFGFTARTGDAYRALSPVIALWLAPAVVAATMRYDVWLFGAWLLGLPWMHHRIKRYQRDKASFGDSHFEFTPALGRFYWIYAKGVGFVLLGLVAMIAIFVAMFMRRGHAEPLVASSQLETWLYGALVALIVYTAAGPYYAARLQQLVWSRTRLGHVRFHSEIRAWPLFRLVVKSVVLTLVTAGLYWPFAAVALARYRIESVRVESEAPLSAFAGGIRGGAVGATGEGTADAFGFDFGL